MQTFMYFREQVKASKLWVFHHKLFNCIYIQVASFPVIVNCLMYGPYKGSKIITHFLINLFISKLFLRLFNIIIPIPEFIRWKHYQGENITFYVFCLFIC